MAGDPHTAIYLNNPAAGCAPGACSYERAAALTAGIAPAPTFAPDIAIGIRSTDFFARYDPAILARTDHAPAAPSGDATAVNGASFRAEQGLAPGSYAAAFGSFGQPPDGVLVAGIAAQIVSATATQVNFVVPTSTAVGNASISVRAGGREVAAGQAAITSEGPGLFMLTADPWQPGAVENQDSSVNSASNPAAVGSIVSIYATGAGRWRRFRGYGKSTRRCRR